MKMKLKKWAAAAMTAVMTLGAANVYSAGAAEDTKIVVLGDSVSFGADLAEGERSYVQLVEEAFDAELRNFSFEGGTTKDVLDSLNDSEVRTALEHADVIIVNVGIHDIMDPFMETANGFMEKFKFERFSDVFFAQLADYNLTEMDLQFYAADLTQAVKSNAVPAKENMLEIGKQLSAYSDAHIVFENVYNPIDTIENLDELSDKRKFAYTTVSGIVTNTLNTSVNEAITELSAEYGYDVLDIHSAFAGKAYQYVHLDELNVNPTAEGHRVIADQTIEQLKKALEIKGDVTGDRNVDAKDAAEILVHASDVGAGGSGTLDESAKTLGDVDGSGNLDASDAAKILVYASEQSAGGNPSWD